MELWQIEGDEAGAIRRTRIHRTVDAFDHGVRTGIACVVRQAMLGKEAGVLWPA